MSSTEATDFETKARKLHGQRIVRIAAAWNQEGREAFPLAPDARLLSYFEIPRKARLTRDDLEAVGPISINAFFTALGELWKNDGSEDLLALLEELRTLADSGAPTDVPDDDVSPFIYAMY